jgi:hypothetical protein
MSHWSVTWTACFATISAPRVSAIETYLAEKVENLAGEEINQAVESLACNWDSKVMGAAPGIGLLISTIKGGRKRKAGIDMSEPYDVMVLRKRCLFLPLKGLSRWDLICEAQLSHGSDNAHKIIKACVIQDGLTIPWWTPATIPHTIREDKPRGVASWVDCMSDAVNAREVLGEVNEPW